MIVPILMASLGCVLVWAVVAAFTPPLHHLLKYHAAAVVIIAVSAELARRGYTQAGAALFAFCIWALTQLPPFTVGHLALPGVVLPIIGVLAAGLLWSSTAAMVLAAASSLIWLGALWAGQQGLLVEAQPRSEFQFWLLLTEALFMTSVFIHVVTRAMQGSLATTQEAVHRARRVVEMAPDAIITVDGDGVVRTANRAAGHITGIPADRLVGQSIFLPGLLSARDATAAEEAFRAALTGERLPAFETEVLRPDGTVAVVEALAHRLRAPGETGLELVLRDITSRRRAAELRDARAEQLGVAQRMEAVGQLAGGVAHDFNNLLTAMGGYAELIEEDPGATDSILELTQQIQQAQERAAELTQHLLAFAQRQVVDPRPVSLAAEVSFRQPLLRGLAGDAIDLHVRVSSRDTTIAADQSQLEQILVNLVSNARDAIGGHGTIRLGVDRRTVTRPVSGPAGTVPGGDYVVLTVQDTGPGIPAEIRDKIFEPFYTTKEVGAGTGLGLSAVLGIVRQAGGQILVDGHTDMGATVEVWFPHRHRRDGTGGETRDQRAASTRS